MIIVEWLIYRRRYQIAEEQPTGKKTDERGSKSGPLAVCVDLYYRMRNIVKSDVKV